MLVILKRIDRYLLGDLGRGVLDRYLLGEARRGILIEAHNLFISNLPHNLHNHSGLIKILFQAFP